jgi:hypothetical protein
MVIKMRIPKKLSDFPGFRSGKWWKMLLAIPVYLFVGFMIFGYFVFGPPDARNQSSVLTPTPTFTANATEIEPSPTIKTQAASTSVVTTSTATPSSTVTPFTPIILSGKGQKATDLFYLPQGLVRFELTHDGESNFGVWLMDDQGHKKELLVNEIGTFVGSKAVRIDKSGQFLLDIGADGNWKITIK